MNSTQNLTRPAIECLESRRLLSASPTAHASIDRLATSTHVKKTIPLITGASYTGTLDTSTGNVFSMVLAIVKETKAGGLHGTFSVSDTAGESGFYQVSGSVSLNHKITLHGHVGKVTLNVTGTVSADSSAVSGKFTSADSKTHVHGTFSSARIFNN